MTKNLPAQPEMTPKEASCYGSLLDRARSLVEFGAGGSTLYAVRRGISRIVSVESDPGWIARLLDNAEIAAAEKEGRLTLIHVDLGPVASYGAPANTSRIDQWSGYPMAPWEVCDEPDLVLVDGRIDGTFGPAHHRWSYMPGIDI